MKHIKLKGLFTSVTRSAYDVESDILKLKSFSDYDLSITRESDKSLEDADIVICSSLTSFFHSKEHYHKDMIVIVCDGVMQASCLVNAIPLDYEKRNSYDFFFRKPDYSLIKKMSKGVDCEVTKFDMLGLITANSMQGKMILTDYNKVMSYFDQTARYRMQVLVDSILFEKGKMDDLSDFLEKECVIKAHKIDAISFLKSLDENLGALKKGLKSSSKDFELAYLRKMHASIKNSKERTAVYTDRVKGYKNVG